MVFSHQLSDDVVWVVIVWKRWIHREDTKGAKKDLLQSAAHVKTCGLDDYKILALLMTERDFSIDPTIAERIQELRG